MDTIVKDPKLRVVVFCTPSLNNRVTCEYFESAIRTEWLLRKHGIFTSYKIVAGDQFIAKARNRLVTEFLQETPANADLFFLDDDIGWPAEAVLRLLKRPEGVVAGVYPKRADGEVFPVELKADAGKLVCKNGLYPANLAPCGFMRIKKGVLEKLAEKESTYIETIHDGSKHKRYCIFEAGLGDTGEWCGEDYVLGRKLEAMGEQIWIDPDIDFAHRGAKCWYGNLMKPLKAHLEKQETQPAPELSNA